MKYVAFGLAAWLFAGCTVVARYTYECEGKCRGSLNRELEAVYPEDQPQKGPK